MDNQDRALAVVEGIGTGTIDRALFAHDATWQVLPSGPVGVDAFLETLVWVRSRRSGPGVMTVVGATAGGDRVAVEATSNTPMVNGETYRNAYHFLFVFDGGRIQAVREYMDTAYAAAFFKQLAAAEPGERE